MPSRLFEKDLFLVFLDSMSRKYKFHNKSALYFVSFATVNWIEVFTRQVYFDVLAKSITYCREKKEWNFMPTVLCQVMFIYCLGHQMKNLWNC